MNPSWWISWCLYHFGRCLSIAQVESCHWTLRGVSLEPQGSGFMVVREAEEVMGTYGDQERHLQKGNGDVGREGQFIVHPTLQVQGSDRDYFHFRKPFRDPTRLLRPWDFPGKSTGVGCHCLLHLSLIHLLKCSSFHMIHLLHEKTSRLLRIILFWCALHPPAIGIIIFYLTIFLLIEWQHNVQCSQKKWLLLWLYLFYLDDRNL